MNVNYIRLYLFIGLAFLCMNSFSGDTGSNCPKKLKTDVADINAYAKLGCYKNDSWQQESGVRATTFMREINASPMVHNYVRAYYSPKMVKWLKKYRPSGSTVAKAKAIPNNAAIMVEVYSDATSDTVTAVLSMVRQRGTWVFARYQPATVTSVESEIGGLNFPSCRGCHAFENAEFLHASYATLTSTEPAQAKSLELLINSGTTSPEPVFQRGDELSKRLEGDDPAVNDFLTFYSAHTTQPLVKYEADDIVHFPPQTLDTVQEGADSTGSYPILCDDCFYTAEYCAGCHSSTISGTTTALPQMNYQSSSKDPHAKAPDNHYYANWSMFGEYSASIMGLASRDPIWQAQVEQELHYNSGVNPTTITNVCFRCHGPMGQRQLMDDKNEEFNRFTFFSVYDDNDENYKNPYPNEPAADPKNALYGALARDGISCAMCHFMGPNKSSDKPGGIWDGKDYQVFYGDIDSTVSQREDPPGPAYPFIGEPQYRTDNDILGPTAPSFLNQQPMKEYEKLGLNQAYNEKTNESYLREGQFCGSCHSLVVPKIPTGYKAGGSVAEAQTHPYYEKPETCNSTTFAANANPVTDPCVALSYEQSTYFEWANSGFPEKDMICQTCHMPLINAEKDDHTAIVAQFEGDTTTAKTYRRHRVLGINLFVSEMFQQFNDVLGITTEDPTVPEGSQFVKHNLLNAEQSIVEQATFQAEGVPGKASVDVEISRVDISDNTLTVETFLTNNAGHKFPSGAGFRRAFVELQVLDKAGDVLWSSGQPNRFGVICDGLCNSAGDNFLPGEFPTAVVDNFKQLQPHYETITQENQAQIYEVREIDDLGYLTSRTLSLFKGAKDNRIQPAQWVPPAERCSAENKDKELLGMNLCQLAHINAAESMVPGSMLEDDPYYHDSKLTGQDKIVYAIPTIDLDGKTPASVTATLYYQSIPPGYLIQRFNEGFIGGDYSDATKRQIYLTSHLNLNLGLQGADPNNKFDLVNNNWSMTIDTVTKTIK